MSTRKIESTTRFTQKSKGSSPGPMRRATASASGASWYMRAACSSSTAVALSSTLTSLLWG